MSRQTTPSTTLENLKREAKRWLKALRANVGEARERLNRALPNAPEHPTLRDVQHALAREHGLPGWTALRARLDHDAPIRRYERVAEALVTAYHTGDDRSMRMVRDYFGHMRTWDAMRRYIRLDLGRHEEPHDPDADALTIADTRYLVARSQGFESWEALAAFATSIPAGRSAIAERSIAMYAGDHENTREVAARSRDWDEVVGAIREWRLTGLDASGQMTDALLERVSRLDHITTLDLGGSRSVTDHGLRHLARLPGLRHLDLSNTDITDAGLDVLRRLPELRSVALAWTRVTDDGAANLASCEKLEAVDLTGTETGDGAIRALDGKCSLRDLGTGRRVTDGGLAALHALPVFKTWQGGEARMSLLGFSARPNHLMLRGSFTDAGLGDLVGLDGLFALSLNRDGPAITGAGLAPFDSKVQVRYAV